MSKIYEALLRAELERAVSTDKTTSGSPVAIHDLLLPAEEPAHAHEEIDNFEPSLQQEMRESGFVASYSPSPDLSQVVLRSWSPSLASLPALEERGAGVEQFRSLRSHVVEFREQKPLKTVLVSSGLPGEGKSYVALNLAVSFAKHKGNRVLLIDGDMRRSSLHKLLGAPREPGLSEYLSGTADILDVMQRPSPSAMGIQLATGLATLTFISGGVDPDKAGDLATNSRFSQLITTVSPAFDWIIVDSSPVNLVSDAVSLSHSCDGVLLVCREGVTRYKTAQQAQAQFKSANVLGFVMNAVHQLPKGDYYGSYDTYRAEA